MNRKYLLKTFIFSAFLGLNTINAQEIYTLEKEEVQEKTIEVEKQERLSWIATYKDALDKSKKEHKPILIYFTGSDWCSPCKLLDRELFKSKAFEKIAKEDLIILKVDYPRNKDLVSSDKLKENFKLIRKYKVNSYPTIIFTNGKGSVITRKKGFFMADAYLDFIKKSIARY